MIVVSGTQSRQQGNDWRAQHSPNTHSLWLERIFNDVQGQLSYFVVI